MRQAGGVRISTHLDVVGWGALTTRPSETHSLSGAIKLGEIWILGESLNG